MRASPVPRPWLLALCVFVPALVLYLATMAPGLYWGDSAGLQEATAKLDYDASVRGYPLWVSAAAGLARVSGLPPPLAANVFSVITGALAVMLFFGYALALTGSRLAALTTAATLATCHLLWSSSVVAEVYALAACLLAALLWAAESARGGSDRGSILFGLLAGVALLHHRMLQLATLAIVPVLALAWSRDRRLLRGIALSSAGFALGAIPLLLLLLGPEGDLGEKARGFLLGSFRPRLQLSPAWMLGFALYELRFLAFNLAGPQILTLLPGVREALRAGGTRFLPLLAVTLASLLSPLVFPHVGDRYVLLLPAVCSLSVLAGLGAREVGRAISGRGIRAAIPLSAAVVPVLLYAALSHTGVHRSLGLFPGAHPDHVRSFVWPGLRGVRDAEETAERILSALPEGAVLLTGWGEGRVLHYLRDVEGRREDVRLVPYDALPDVLGEGRRGLDLFLSAYPYLPTGVDLPEGYRREQVLPGTLWRIAGPGLEGGPER